jgi:hypothetical protein
MDIIDVQRIRTSSNIIKLLVLKVIHTLQILNPPHYVILVPPSVVQAFQHLVATKGCAIISTPYRCDKHAMGNREQSLLCNQGTKYANACSKS